jgi:hypothetical protein
MHDLFDFCNTTNEVLLIERFTDRSNLLHEVYSRSSRDRGFVFSSGGLSFVENSLNQKPLLSHCLLAP